MLIIFIGAKLLISLFGIEFNEFVTFGGIVLIIAAALLFERYQKATAAPVAVTEEEHSTMPDQS